MAKRFQFNLESVLKVRRARADKTRREFAAVQRQVMDAQARLAQYQALEREGKAVLADMSRKTLDIAQIRLQKQYLFAVAQRIQISVQETQGLEKQLDERRRVLIEDRRDERAMELLREKRLEQYRYELDRAEQKILDDMKNPLSAR